MNHISNIVKKLGLDENEIVQVGNYKAKIPFKYIKDKPGNGKLIVVTGITPTKAGEGKTTTAIGLTQGLNKLGKLAITSLREPSLGPVFGIKGGGTGGGKSKVVPEDEINIHFTGDAHAIGSAHNLLSALVDNAVQRNQIDNMTADGITWNRVTDVLDRGLRNIVTGLGGSNNAPLRETSFDIVTASEIMAIMALSKNLDDLRNRLERIVVGNDNSGNPIYVKDFNIVGSLLSVLRHALMPNIVQTTEGNPALIHTGPFGNIAHGCSSVIGDTFATQVGDYVLSEAGFGADLGFEKFMDIKVRQGGPKPFCALIVATIRGLKWHGGIEVKNLSESNIDAITKGSENLINAIRIVSKYGLRSVVAINLFPEDKKEEIDLIKKICLENNSIAIESDGFAKGGEGMIDLAEYIANLDEDNKDISLLYDDQDSPINKVETLAKEIYSAEKVSWGPMTRTTLRQFENQGWNFPICMAKTHLSVSANPKLRGAPKGHTIPIREARVLGGAKQIVTLAGDIITLPGLPSNPNAFDIDLNDEGEIINILST